MPREPQTTRKRVSTSAAAARLISVRLATVSGGDFPRALVYELARVVPVSGVLLGERADAHSSWHSVACRIDDQIIPEFEFALNEDALGKRRPGPRVVAGTLTADGIDDARNLNILAVPFERENGDIVGLIGLLQRDDIPDAKWLPLLRTFVHRAAVELETSRRLRESERAEQELRVQSRLDPLTGALNHGAIADTMRQLAAAPDVERCALVIVDVDGLKATNDTYSHDVGDAVLRSVVRAMSLDGVAVGRYGGDEYIAILPGADIDRADRYREEVLTALDALRVEDPASGARVPIALSVGMAIYPDESENIDDLIRLAESALYAARDANRAQSSTSRRLDADRASRLVGELVPLLTAPGTREEKLSHVANQLSVGAGYEAVNFEVSGESAEPGASWEGAYTRAAQQNVESWVREQAQASDHPLGRRMEQTRRPIFIDCLDDTDLLTESERKLITEAGLNSALVVPMIWHEKLVGMLSVASKQPSGFTPWDAQFLTAVSSQVTAIVFMTTLVEELQVASAHLKKAHSDTVMMLAAAAEAHDDTTGRHLQRVRLVTEALARELGYSDEHVHQVGLAAVLHDIGKVRVPDSVLSSSNSLSPEEWVMMKQHTMWGGEFLSGRHGFDLAADVARCHHERWDGGGYPRGLKGDEIPEAAAITSVADSFDAMTNDRPYRQGRPAAEAVKEIVSCSGTQFNPRVVDALVRLFKHRGLPMGDADELETAA